MTKPDKLQSMFCIRERVVCRMSLAHFYLECLSACIFAARIRSHDLVGRVVWVTSHGQDAPQIRDSKL